MKGFWATLVGVVTLAVFVPLAAAPERVRIAAVVTDRLGRVVPGLTAKDFELRVDGVVQRIESVEPRGQAPRRIAILLDEFHVDAADTPIVRDAVSAFVSTTLRADDMLVVLKPLDPLTTIRLTNDRGEATRAVASFSGRNGIYEPRTALEEETMGRAPALVESGRSQVVLSGLRALAAQLGTAAGRSAILIVSNGFTQQEHPNVRGLPDLGNVERFANRYDVPIYAFDPRVPAPGDAEPSTAIDKLVGETGGAIYRGSNLSANLSRAAVELDSGYTLTYTPAHTDDGKFHPVQISVARTVLARAGGADARARAGYISALPPDLRRSGRAADHGPLLTTRMIHRSPLINAWSGVTRVDAGLGHIAVTWLPASTSASAVQIALKATTGDGRLLFEGFVSPVRLGEPGNDANPDRVEFDAPSGKVQIDMTILGSRGEKLDVDARDIEVPAAKGAAAIILPPIMIGTQSAREFRAAVGDANSAPDPAHQFRRTDRVLIRVPAYAAGQPVPVSARLLNRVGQVLQTMTPLPDRPNGITQFDLTLAPLAPGDYFLQFSAVAPSGQVDQRVPFKITG
ncbi:MAG TPA: VWA domain-containing protein [Vicinamibacterales bacterium]|nr:VWA domain-containing protein [Vicinamibacterales bacterium]